MPQLLGCVRHAVAGPFDSCFVLSNACRLSCTGTCASAAPPASAGHQGSLTINAAGSAAADNPQVQRHLTLYHGVVPLLLELNPDAETTFNAAISELVTRGYLRKVGRASQALCGTECWPVQLCQHCCRIMLSSSYASLAVACSPACAEVHSPTAVASVLEAPCFMLEVPWVPS